MSDQWSTLDRSWITMCWKATPMFLTASQAGDHTEDFKYCVWLDIILLLYKWSEMIVFWSFNSFSHVWKRNAMFNLYFSIPYCAQLWQIAAKNILVEKTLVDWLPCIANQLGWMLLADKTLVDCSWIALSIKVIYCQSFVL